VFNYRLSRAYRVVENAFSILNSVFRVKKTNIIRTGKSQKTVMVTLYLHKFLRKNPSSCVLYTPGSSLNTENNGQVIPGRWSNDNKASSLQPLRVTTRRTGNNAKEKLCKTFCYKWGNSLGIINPDITKKCSVK
jgi:hypothetical protein